MFQFLRNLFGSESEKPSQAEQRNAEQQGLNLTPLVEQAAVSVYERENGRAATDEEKAAIRKTVREIAAEPYESGDYDPAEDPELAEIYRQEAIEELAQKMRLVVVNYVEAMKEPYPYKVKRNLAEIKQSHSFVIGKLDTNIYPDAVAYAREDMFEGWSKLLEDVEENRVFFEDYVKDPRSLNLLRIRENMPENYRADMDEALFSLS